MAEPSCTFLYILVGMIEGNHFIQLEIQKKKNFFFTKKLIHIRNGLYLQSHHDLFVSGISNQPV